MANYVSKHTGAQIDAAVENVGVLDGKVITLSEEMSEQSVTPQMFGAVADGVADDSDAIQTALNKGGMVYLPDGRYKITKTLTIGSNTTMMGAGDDSVIFLGDGGENLTPHDWYIDSTTYPQYYPYITTAEGASRIKISRIRVEGNTETASANLHVGIAAESAADVLVEHVSVWKINYFPENAPPRPSGQWRTGWNIAFLRSERIELAHSTVQYGAYECVRIGTMANDIWVHDCLIEYGWRTGLQIIEGCNRVTVERCTINQDDFDAYDTNACITLHPSDANHSSNIVIRGCALTGKLYTGDAGGSGIFPVWNTVDNLVVEDCYLKIVADELFGIDTVEDTIVKNCTISASYACVRAKGGVLIDQCKMYSSSNVGVLAYDTTDGKSITIRNSAISAVGASKTAVYATDGNVVIDTCELKSDDACVLVLASTAEKHISIVNSELATGRTTAVIISREDGSNGKWVSFDIRNNRMDGQIYISQPNVNITDKCAIIGNTINPASASTACIQNDYSSTVYKLLTIKDNILTGGKEAIKIWGAGMAVIKDNDASGCVSGISATNASNIVDDNILPT